MYMNMKKALEEVQKVSFWTDLLLPVFCVLVPMTWAVMTLVFAQLLANAFGSQVQAFYTLFWDSYTGIQMKFIFHDANYLAGLLYAVGIMWILPVAAAVVIKFKLWKHLK